MEETIEEKDSSEEPLEDFTEYQVIDKHTTECEHEWVREGMNLNMVSLVCSKCWSGCQVDEAQLKEIRNGKIVWK